MTQGSDSPVDVSIVIPAYNQGRFLGQAIESALGQQLTSIEVIVIDDGSTDETPTVAASFDDQRLRYVRQDNQGLSGARNTGLAHARAERVAFLDADDRLQPSGLVTLLARLESDGDADMVVGAVERIDASGQRLGSVLGPPGSLTLADLVLGNRFAPSGVLVRKAWIDRARGFDRSLNACEDWDLWLRLLRLGCRLRVTRAVVGCYRIHGSQMTQQASRMRDAGLQVLDKFYAERPIPIELEALRGPAYGQVYLGAVARQIRAGAMSEARANLDAALDWDPGLAADRGARLAETLVGWAHDEATPDSVAFLMQVRAQLPRAMALAASRLRLHLADAWWQRAMQDDRRGRPQDAALAAWASLRLAPRRLGNRGLVSILLRNGVRGLLLRSTRASLAGPSR